MSARPAAIDGEHLDRFAGEVYFLLSNGEVVLHGRSWQPRRRQERRNAAQQQRRCLDEFCD